MKRILLIVLQILAVVAIRSHAGILKYEAIPDTQSDANCGISTNNQYTSAVDGGNTSGTDRVVNGITLFALEADGQTSTADNCTLNALSGSLSNGDGKPAAPAEGSVGQVLSDVTLNNDAADNSQQEIVLDTESLEAGATYDLRVYVGHGAGQDRQVNLSFVGDGQDPVESGFFNEDDARTSAGGFKDADQMYYISYVFTWDGDSTPGITITQKSGSAPFVLYALTNQLVSGGATQATAAGGAQATAGGGEALQAAAGEGGLTTGQVDNESDEVGVESDDFYNNESLNSNGKWIGVGKYGRCWQPTNVPSGWAPYTNGTFQNCDDCGATFVSDEPWAWATYHFGRWCKVRSGCGWAWVPGKVWAGSWVSWRRGKTDACECIGWAPLPPEASCEVDVGISSWVDETCNIGPEAYTFINVVDFGRESYFGCGCIYERNRNVTVIIDTFNCTNISYGRHVNIYCGGVDFNWCNTKIRKHGGRECDNIHVNRYDDPEKMGGKFSKHEGKQLGLLSPRIKGEKNSKHAPKISEHLGEDKIDKGWGKDKKAEKQLRNHIAKENGGKNPKNSPARLDDNVAKQMKQGGTGNHPGKHGKGTGVEPLTAGGQGAGGFKQHGKGKGKGQGAAGLTDAAGDGGTFPGNAGAKGKKGQGKGQLDNTGVAGAGGFNQHPGKGRNKGKNAGDGGNANLLGGQTAGAGGFNQHPGKGKNKGKNAGDGGNANLLGGQNAGAGGFNQHPGKGKNKGKNAGDGGNANLLGGQTAGGGGGKHPGQKRSKTGMAATDQTGAGGAGGNQNLGGKGKNKGQKNFGNAGDAGGTGDAGNAGGGGGTGKRGKHQKTQGQTFNQGAGAGQAGGTGQGGGGGGKRGKHQKTQGQTLNQGVGAGQAGGTGQGGGGGGTGKHRKQKNQGQTLNQGAGAGQGGNAAGGGGGGKGKHQKQQNQMMMQGQGQAGGGGGGRGQRRQQQQGQGQGQNQQQQGGKKGKKGKPTTDPTLLSDLRTKNDISFVGWSPMGIPIYQFSYKNEPNKRYQGTIAQAIRRIRPDAVVWRNGLMFVDYSKLDIEMTELPAENGEIGKPIPPPVRLH